ncbi:hypothetical protein BJ508DRAFT_34751 [Ascobolus immersus RN42]|uniref:Uncharacterized protein n=1 Tax=Ascobolus immersus RN42 TaxID=1160509 RepID=A0A3N4HL62_ASCIM|nr:hypothetical protein BJ508DRAFT_34751 [Ascobolus immersus RN42]
MRSQSRDSHKHAHSRGTDAVDKLANPPQSQTGGQFNRHSPVLPRHVKILHLILVKHHRFHNSLTALKPAALTGSKSSRAAADPKCQTSPSCLFARKKRTRFVFWIPNVFVNLEELLPTLKSESAAIRPLAPAIAPLVSVSSHSASRNSANSGHEPPPHPPFSKYPSISPTWTE